MLCQICKKNPATVHVQEIVNGEKRIMHFCAECAEKKSMLEPFLRLLISDGLPVTFEYTVYSWDEKHKTGQVALLLVYDVKRTKTEEGSK